MINVTPPAKEQIKAYFNDKKVQPIRLFINSSGCGGPSLAMALDEATENDLSFTHDGIDYVMEKTLMAQASPVEVDYSGMGFHLKSSLDLGGGCSTCGSGGSCCSS